MRLFNRSIDVEAVKHKTNTKGETPLEKPLESAARDASESAEVAMRSVFEASSRQDTSASSDKFAVFLEKYDPRPQEMPEVFPLADHRDTIRTMYLDNILYRTAKLHRHNWIFLSKNEQYKELCTPERWDQIQEDLERYTKSIQCYETWLNSMIQKMDLEPSNLPPAYHTYGKTLAILECASLHPTPAELPFLQGLREGLALSHAQWSRSNIAYRQREKSKHKAMVGRIAMAIFAGATLIIPMVIMVEDQRKLTTLLTTSIFTVVIALILAIWMKDAKKKDIIAATAAYAAVLVVFVGGAGNTPSNQPKKG